MHQLKDLGQGRLLVSLTKCLSTESSFSVHTYSSLLSLEFLSFEDLPWPKQRRIQFCASYKVCVSPVARVFSSGESSLARSLSVHSMLYSLCFCLFACFSSACGVFATTQDSILHCSGISAQPGGCLPSQPLPTSLAFSTRC